tara:strand:- start:405 stop:962 length:558 start_codon:yes stop_codon:yes gene_type:complete
MSFVRIKKEAQVPIPNTTSESNLFVKFDVVPIPKGASKYEPSKAEAQRTSMAMITARGKDLFEENPTKVSLKKGVRLYQSTQLYHAQLPVEDLIPMLTSSDLTLRVSALRRGVDSHSTCMELKTGILADLMQESADFKGDKVTKLVLPNEEHGAMYVALQENRGKHYIQKVDYEIVSQTDDKMHI